LYLKLVEFLKKNKKNKIGGISKNGMVFFKAIFLCDTFSQFCRINFQKYLGIFLSKKIIIFAKLKFKTRISIHELLKF